MTNWKRERYYNPRSCWCDSVKCKIHRIPYLGKPQCKLDGEFWVRTVTGETAFYPLYVCQFCRDHYLGLGWLNCVPALTSAEAWRQVGINPLPLLEDRRKHTEVSTGDEGTYDEGRSPLSDK